MYNKNLKVEIWERKSIWETFLWPQKLILACKDLKGQIQNPVFPTVYQSEDMHDISFEKEEICDKRKNNIYLIQNSTSYIFVMKYKLVKFEYIKDLLQLCSFYAS